MNIRSLPIVFVRENLREAVNEAENFANAISKKGGKAPLKRKGAISEVSVCGLTCVFIPRDVYSYSWCRGRYYVVPHIGVYRSDRAIMVHCTKCREIVDFDLETEHRTDTANGIEFDYIETTARCRECGSEVYVPWVNDCNAHKREDGYKIAVDKMRRDHETD